MPIVTPKTHEVTTWQGLHLFHYGMSNCSQRVRIMLEEKQLPWTGHIIDISRGDNLTDYYQGINPNGVVPTLVHDGVVIIESTDIIQYLDEIEHPSAVRESFMSGVGIEDTVLEQLISLAIDAQANIKVLTFEYLFKPMVRKNQKELDELESKLRNRELLHFHQQFSSKDGFPLEKVHTNVCEMHNKLQFLEGCLESKEWLAGEKFSIADITWIVNLHRLQLMRFPLGQYPALLRWTESMRERPSFDKALKQYEPAAARGVLGVYTWFRANWGKRAFANAAC